MPTQCFLHLLHWILKNDDFFLYWIIFTYYLGKTPLGVYLNTVLEIITDTSAYDTGLLETQWKQTVNSLQS